MVLAQIFVFFLGHVVKEIVQIDMNGWRVAVAGVLLLFMAFVVMVAVAMARMSSHGSGISFCCSRSRLALRLLMQAHVITQMRRHMLCGARRTRQSFGMGFRMLSEHFVELFEEGAVVKVVGSERRWRRRWLLSRRRGWLLPVTRRWWWRPECTGIRIVMAPLRLVRERLVCFAMKSREAGDDVAVNSEIVKSSICENQVIFSLSASVRA